VLIDSDAKLVDVAPQIFDLRPSRHISCVFKILQCASNLSPMALGLSSNVFQRRLGSCERSIEFEPKCPCIKYSIYAVFSSEPDGMLNRLRC